MSIPLPPVRGHWLTPTRLKSYTTLTAVAVLFTYLFFVGRSVPKILAGHTPYIDLVVFWVVAKNTLSGHAQDMYDLLKLHRQVLLVCPDEKKWQAWSYPPLFYLIITPPWMASLHLGLHPVYGQYDGGICTCPLDGFSRKVDAPSITLFTGSLV